MNGTELKRLRLLKKLTQAELSDLSGIPKGTIGRIESTGDDIKKVDMMMILNEIFKIEESNRIITQEEKLNVERNIQPQPIRKNILSDVEPITQKEISYNSNATLEQHENSPPSDLKKITENMETLLNNQENQLVNMLTITRVLKDQLEKIKKLSALE